MTETDEEGQGFLNFLKIKGVKLEKCYFRLDLNWKFLGKLLPSQKKSQFRQQILILSETENRIQPAE